MALKQPGRTVKTKAKKVLRDDSKVQKSYRKKLTNLTNFLTLLTCLPASLSLNPVSTSTWYVCLLFSISLEPLPLIQTLPLVSDRTTNSLSMTKSFDLISYFQKVISSAFKLGNQFLSSNETKILRKDQVKFIKQNPQII